MDLEIGQVFVDRYFVNRLIGRGSTGQVYEARDAARGGRVAIRMLETNTEHGIAFNEREAMAIGRLGNPHLTEFVRVEPLPSGDHCIISQFVDGEPLQRKMERFGCMTPFGLSKLLAQLLDGLTAAHRGGIIHRDLTPRSVFLVPGKAETNASFKLIDFGLSRFDVLKAAAVRTPAILDLERDSLQYLSPEQLSGQRQLDAPSNIYSLGVISYRAITGRLPFQSADFPSLVSDVLKGESTPVEELAAATSPTLTQLIRKAMAPSPSARFHSAEEMLAAVNELAADLGEPANAEQPGDAWYFESPRQAATDDRVDVTGWRAQERPELVSEVRAALSPDTAEVSHRASPPALSQSEDAITTEAVHPRASEPPATPVNEQPNPPGSFRLRQSTVPGIQPISGPIHEVPMDGTGEVGAGEAGAVEAKESAALSGGTVVESGPSNTQSSSPLAQSVAPTSTAKEPKRAAAALALSTALPRTTDQARAAAAQRAARRSARPNAETRRAAVALSEPPREQRIESEPIARGQLGEGQPGEDRLGERQPAQSRKQVIWASLLALLAGGGVLLAWLHGRSAENVVAPPIATEMVKARAAQSAIESSTSPVSATPQEEKTAAGQATTSSPAPTTQAAPISQKLQPVPHAVSGSKRVPSATSPAKKSGGSRRDSAKDPYNYR